MSNPNYDSSKLATVKTYITIAFVFSILSVVIFALLGVWQIINYATWSDVFGIFGAGYATGFLVTAIIYLVFAVISVLVFLRTRKMYAAVNQGDVNTLKQYNNMMWAIIALIFAAVLTGIMLLLAFGPINELGRAPAQGAYPPPPPPT